MCSCAANKPLEIIPCKSVLCTDCCLALSKSSHFICPGCSCEHQSTDSTFTELSALSKKVFNELSVRCGKCIIPVKLEMMSEDCDSHRESQKLTLEDIMTQPQQKANDSIKKAAVKVVTGMLEQSDSGCLTVSTGGRVRCIINRICITFFKMNPLAHQPSESDKFNHINWRSKL